MHHAGIAGTDCRGACLSEILLSGANLFPEAWQEALSKDAAVPREAVQHLLPLGEELGASDLEGQLETLAQYARQLEPYAKEAESRCCRLQRLYLSMGILGGLMAAVLLA